LDNAAQETNPITSRKEDFFFFLAFLLHVSRLTVSLCAYSFSQEAPSILSYHKHSVAKALLDLFPQTGIFPLQWLLFLFAPFYVLDINASNTRIFLENFAERNLLDPLNSESWYQLVATLFSKERYC
jgi:hypothetical protein